jgi:succinate dehydrogenase/fumarate reductase flavoprotein subunit
MLAMQSDVSRRKFLTEAAGIAAAAAAGAGMVGSAHAQEQQSDKPWLPESWDYETDVLVIGYGGAGQWAGLIAYDEGADVMFLEKSPFRGGGSSSINMGQWTAPHDADAAAKFAYEAFHGQTPMDVCQAWAEEAVQNPDYADKYGIEYTLGDSPRAEYEFFDGFDQMYVGQGTGWGAATFEVLDQHIQDRNIPIIFDCHDEELIQDPVTKEILGAYTLVGDDQTPKAVKARKGVCLCTGGFEFNYDLQAKYLKCYPMKGFYGWKYNTGDGIGIAQKVGADLWHMQQVCGGVNSFFDDPEIVPGGVSTTIPTPNFIEVDRLGHRFINEDTFAPHGGWKPYAHFDEEICDFDRIPSWYIFDDTAFKGGTLGNPVGGASIEAGGTGIGYTTPGLDPELGGWEGWSTDNQWELERGWIKTGDTLEELVEQIHGWDPDYMDLDTLKASIDRWNELCDKGVDEDFGRKKLAKIETPPFYAVNLYPGICNTIGGARRNGKAQVLDPDGNPIPRLYSAGSFGNMAGHTYAITGGNGSENWCVGRIAGREAAHLDGWE